MGLLVEEGRGGGGGTSEISEALAESATADGRRLTPRRFATRYFKLHV